MTHPTLRPKRCACCENATRSCKKERSAKALRVMTRLRVGKDEPLPLAGGRFAKTTLCSHPQHHLNPPEENTMNRRWTVLRRTLVLAAGVAVVFFGWNELAPAQDKAASSGSTLETSGSSQATEDAIPSDSNFREAYSAAFWHREAGEFQKSRSALEAAIKLVTPDREVADAHRTLISAHSELGDQERMFESPEIMGNAVSTLIDC
ncbi:hypothetical protein [Rhodopirellula sp. P2]|uniref:hypothetical protein n=1 Tax=Rhodopirellula sp. P2 TaxID=2127060 RepID=UPI0023674F50|nr:hypothetical protein [Rhodopirellula sp. P2]WDQ19209.1 hypothetical protein PSR62_11915 [Rhodopirellula sp. P2]